MSRELSAEDTLRDRTIEMVETAEEVVVGKPAFVEDELTIQKDTASAAKRSTTLSAHQIQGRADQNDLGTIERG